MATNFTKPVGKIIVAPNRYGIWAQDLEGRWDYLSAHETLDDAKDTLADWIEEDHEYWQVVITDSLSDLIE